MTLLRQPGRNSDPPSEVEGPLPTRHADRKQSLLSGILTVTYRKHQTDCNRLNAT